MTEINFYDDMNQNCSVEMMTDENFFSYFLAFQEFHNLNKEVSDTLDCSVTSTDKGFVNFYLNTRMDNMNLLHKAIELGREENVMLLLSYGVKIDEKDIFGKTPLHFTASLKCHDSRKMLRIAKLLLDKACDAKSLLNDCTNSGETPLHCSVESNRKDLIKLFLQYGANVNAKNRDGKTPLYFAIESKNTEVATILLKNRAKVNEKMIHGLTSLHEAVKQKAERCVRLLLDHGAKVNAKDIQGNTPIHYAAQLDYMDEPSMDKIVKLLLNNGADVNDHSNSGETAFRYAVVDGNEKLVKLFLDYGADVNSKDFEGKSLLHLAIKHSNKNIVKLLLNRGVDIGVRTSDGQVALHVAVIVEDENMVKMLLEYDADVNAMDENGRTPLSLAFEVAHMRSIYNPWNGFYPISSQTGSDDNIFELLIKQIATMRHVCEENFRVISNNDSLHMFYKRCQLELIKMNETKVCDNITLYKILTGDVHAVVGYARNEKLADVFETNLCEREFPIYSRVLRDKFLKADQRRRLLEPSAMNLAALVRPFVLPELVINSILTYMSIEDLEKLRMMT